MKRFRSLVSCALRSPLLGAAVVACLLLVATASPARAGSWARVKFDGTLEKSRGVLANFKDGTGSYRIVFRKSVEKCVPVITPAGLAGFMAAESTNPGEIVVYAYDLHTLALKDSWFYIALLC